MLSVLRVAVGLSFLLHGTQKIVGFPPSPVPMPAFDPMTQFGVAGILEAVGGALIVIGFLTRPVAFLLAGEMAVAYFQVHFPKALYPVSNGGEPALLYCFNFLYLMFAGAGAWSIDAMVARGRRHAAPPDERRRHLDAAA
ncbi:MAG: DoxX family protein [bacterium]